MKLHLLQELLDLNRAFENVVRGLERMEKVAPFDKDQVRYARAEVEGARVEANREFFDKFGEIIEKDARWAYKILHDHDRQSKDPFDLYLEIKEREDVRRRKGLPPRVVLLPDWDKDDEQLDGQPWTRKRFAKSRGKTARIRSVKVARRTRTGVAPVPERKK